MRATVWAHANRPQQQRRIADLLERLYDRYNHRQFIGHDPLQFAYRYRATADREIAAFLAAVLAYGRVEQIEKSVSRILGTMEGRPAEFVMGFDKAGRRTLSDFRHRFTSGDDICDLLALLRWALRKFGSIENCFLQGYHPDDAAIGDSLSRFCNLLLAMHAERRGQEAGRGLRYLLVRPEDGSACKRLNLFLRWMVRNDDVDPGLWRSVSSAQLIVPVDVHMGRLCRILGLYDRKNVSMAAAMEITRSFSQITPDDPVKYDFALSRIGIRENCTGRQSDACVECELRRFCVGRWKTIK